MNPRHHPDGHESRMRRVARGAVRHAETTVRLVPLRKGIDDVTIVDDLPPHLTPDTYEAVIVGHEIFTVKMFRNAVKLRLDFDVIESPGALAVRLHGFYNADRIDSSGRPVFRAQSKYARDWRTVTGRRPSRRDRMPPSAMHGVLVTVAVRTTVSDRDQRPLSEPNRYSVVDRIENVIAGGHAPR